MTMVVWAKGIRDVAVLHGATGQERKQQHCAAAKFNKRQECLQQPKRKTKYTDLVLSITNITAVQAEECTSG